MKKYLCVASLFVLNNEVVSWIVLLTLAIMGMVEFYLAVERERGNR